MSFFGGNNVMLNFCAFFFWVSVFAILYTYAIYPLLVKCLSSGKRLGGARFSKEELPSVSVVIAAYNEESVIEKKIRSVLASEYPGNKFEILVGSDASTDGTNQIVLSLCRSFSQLVFVPMQERSGKATVVNRLVEQAKGDIVVITDANILFEKNTLPELVAYFKDQRIGLVDSFIKHTGLKKDGISLSEKTYLSGEALLKHREGILWGVTLGPFGACYALKKEIFTPIPSNALVDDFYVCMSTFKKGYRAISNPDATVWEDISNDIRDEFRRKIRIATGNFQNLSFFYPLLFRWNTVSFAFFSHKILRWFGPVFLLSIVIFSLPLAKISAFYRWFTVLELLVFALLVVDFVLKRVRLNLQFPRLLTHFIITNAAMLLGMIRFISGSKTGIWAPTRRHQ